MSRRSDQQLWEDAAAWYARMQEPRSEQEVEDFEAWLAGAPAHARAYAEMEAISGAAVAAASRLPERTNSPRWGRWHPALAAAVLLAVVATTVLAWGGLSDPAYARVSNPGVAVRGVRLADGTEIWLDAGAEVLVRVGTDQREILLRKGRVRIGAAPGSPALKVVSGALTVVPSTARFDIAIDDQAIVLGAIDGAIAFSSKGGGTMSLPAGQGMVVDAGGAHPASLDTDWPGARLRFTDASLARVAAIANRQPGPDIEFADPSIAKLTVTGVLDVRDTRRLARKLAAAHDLRLVDDGRRLILQR